MQKMCLFPGDRRGERADGVRLSAEGGAAEGLSRRLWLPAQDSEGKRRGRAVKKAVYMVVTGDSFELPCMCGSREEAARFLGITPEAINAALHASGGCPVRPHGCGNYRVLRVRLN